MAVTQPWATMVGSCLAESRRAGLPFEDAWRAAIAAHPIPTDGDEGWLPATVKFARDAFRDGYLRLTAGSSVGALAEREHARPSNVDPEPMDHTRRRCGSGTGCDKPGRPYLCAEHGGIIDAIPPYCNVRACGSDATHGAYCKRHGHLGAAQARAAATKTARAA